MADLQAALQQKGLSATQDGAKKEVQKGFDGKTVRLSIRLEQRKGSKKVTVVRGFQTTADLLQDILRELRKRCGAGGSVEDQSIEIQGDHRTTIGDYLVKQGYSSIDLR